MNTKTIIIISAVVVIIMILIIILIVFANTSQPTTQYRAPPPPSYTNTGNTTGETVGINPGTGINPNLGSTTPTTPTPPPPDPNEKWWNMDYFSNHPNHNPFDILTLKKNGNIITILIRGQTITAPLMTNKIYISDWRSYLVNNFNGSLTAYDDGGVINNTFLRIPDPNVPDPNDKWWNSTYYSIMPPNSPADLLIFKIESGKITLNVRNNQTGRNELYTPVRAGNFIYVKEWNSVLNNKYDGYIVSYNADNKQVNNQFKIV